MNKPCPFCGVSVALGAWYKDGLFTVGCENDECHVMPQVSGLKVQEAWDRWNQRALQQECNPNEQESDIGPGYWAG